MKKFKKIIAIIAWLSIVPVMYLVAGTVTKGLIGKQDISLWDGTSTKTFTRDSSEGYTLTLNQLDWVGVDVFQAYGGGVNRTLGTISTALAAVGSSNKVTFWLSPGEWTITDDVTITSNITLYVPAGAYFNRTANKTITINGPLNAGLYQIFSGSGSVAGLSEVYPQWFGAKADGSTDDSTAVDNAIESSTGATIMWPGGTYAFSSQITSTLSGSQHWDILAPVTFLSTAVSEISKMMLLTLGGDFSIDGADLLFDCDTNSRYGLRIDNSVAQMTSAVNVYLNNVKVKDAYSTDTSGNEGSHGIYIYGAYDIVKLIDCAAENISRASGVGDPGVTGSTGISVRHSGANSYPRQVVFEDVIIDTVTSLESDGDASNVDCDCITASGPSASASGQKLDTVLIVRGGRFTDCRGRSIKSQMESNDIQSVTFIRDGVKSIASGAEVDFQYGSGRLINFSCRYDELSDSSTPFGASFAIVRATAPNYAEEGSVVVSGGEIVNEVATGVDDIPYGLVLAATSPAIFRNVQVSSNTFLGIGRISRLIYGGLGQVRNITANDNFFTNLTSAVVYSNASAANLRVSASNNYNSGTTRSLGVSDSATSFIVSGSNNYGFTSDFSSDSNGTDIQQGLRVTRILPLSSTGGGSIATESVVVADDATHAFSARGLDTGRAIYFISVNHSAVAQGIFSATTGVTLDLTNGASTSIDYGGGSNSDTDTKLNVWIDSGVINIKNRLGSSRTFTLVSIG